MLRTLSTKTLSAEPQIVITRAFIAEHRTALRNAAGNRPFSKGYRHG